MPTVTKLKLINIFWAEQFGKLFCSVHLNKIRLLNLFKTEYFNHRVSCINLNQLFPWVILLSFKISGVESLMER